MSDEAVPELPAGVLAVRRGPGANCSSIGSVVDLLFGAAVVSGMLYAGIVVALGERQVAQVRRPPPQKEPREDRR